MKRQDIEEKYKWDLSGLCSGWDDFQKRIKEIPSKIKDLKERSEGHLLDSAEILYNFYKESQKIEESIEYPLMYVHLKSNVDIGDQESIKASSQINNLLSEYNSAFAFVIPEIISHDFSIIEKYMQEFEPLQEFKYMFDEMFRLKNHTLSVSHEKIMCGYDVIINRFSQSSQFIRNKEMKYPSITLDNGEVVEITASNLAKYASDKSRNVRRQAFDSSEVAIKSHLDSLATNLIGFVHSTEFNAKLRGYENSRKRKFEELGIDEVVYEKLKTHLHSHQESYANYINLYKKVIGDENIFSYDLNAPLVKTNKEYSIEEAKNIILESFKIYGSKYTDMLKFAFDKKCIDFLPSDEKITSWYSSYSPYNHPYVFANYRNRILDISSLCHELGHFCNQYATILNNPPEYVYASSFLGEIASLNNEFVFSNVYREKCDDKNTKLELLGNFIKIFAGNFFRAGCQAIFEEKMHNAINEEVPLSSSVLCQYWDEANKYVMGNIIPHSNMTWAIIPHYFKDNGFYVFTYSTSVIAACNLCNKILKGEDDIIERFNKFLTLGGSMPPMEILKILGIDLTSDETYEVALKMFDDAIEEYMRLINE